MKEEIIKETIRDILNEEMDNYKEAKDIGEMDEVFDRTCEKIEFLIKDILNNTKI